MKIIVLGAGLVPRVGGIAPIRKPFEADERLVRLILGHGSLKPYKVNDDGSKAEITFKNYKYFFAQEKVAATPMKNAAGPFVETKKAAPVENKPAKQESKPAPVEAKPVVEPKKEEKPIQSNTITLDEVDNNKKDWKNKDNNVKTFKPIQSSSSESAKKED